MKIEPKPSDREVLAGLVERVTYHNAENGFCVLRARARGHRDVVTVVGYAATISAGEWITASGEWVNDRTQASSSRRGSCAHRRQLRPTASKNTSPPA
jgi:exodeoxyribonuclease V alpha subunit